MMGGKARYASNKPAKGRRKETTGKGRALSAAKANFVYKICDAKATVGKIVRRSECRRTTETRGKFRARASAQRRTEET